MNWELVPAKESFQTYSEDWDKLNGKYFGNHPYLDSRFVEPLVSHFANGDHLLAIGRENDLVSRMFILERRSTIGWTIFKPSQAQIAPLMMPDLNGLNDLFGELPGLALTIDFLCQDPLCSPFDPDDRRGNEHWTDYVETMAINVQTSFEEYWAGRSRNLRKSIARRIKKYEFEPRLAVLSSGERIQKALYRYGIMESSGWKSKGGTAIHPDNVQGKFYGQVLERFAESGDAFIFELRIGENMAASQVAIGNGQMLVMLKTTFDENLSHLAPGRVLQYLLLEHEFKCRRHKVLEYYTNATDEQKSWGTQIRQIFHVGVARNSATQTVLNAARRLKSLAHRSNHVVNRHRLIVS